MKEDWTFYNGAAFRDATWLEVTQVPARVRTDAAPVGSASGWATPGAARKRSGERIGDAFARELTLVAED